MLHLLSVLVLATPASAYEVMTTEHGDLLSWQELPVGYASNVTSTPVSVSRTGFQAAVDQAVDSWGTVDGSALAFSREGTTETDASYYDDGLNAIYWTEDWEWDPSVLALTSTWTTRSGEVIGFDMRINARDHDFATDGDPERADLLNMLTHELGHAVGLDHSSEPESTMYGSTHVGETQKRDLHPDDEDAVRDLYVPEELTQAAALLGCAVPAGPAALWLGPLILPIVLRRREVR